MLLSCTVIGRFSRPANTRPKMKSFQMPVTCRITATTMIGSAIGSMMAPKMRQKPAPSTRAALNSSSGSAAKWLRKISVIVGRPKIVWIDDDAGERVVDAEIARRSAPADR